jgi:DNA-binding MarR family transcriptional regulator
MKHATYQPRTDHGLSIARRFVGMSASAHPDDIELDDGLDFMRLLWSIEHLLKSTSQLMYRRGGLTGPQRLVLRVVHDHPGITLSELVRLIHLHKSTVAGILRKLERRGLILRDRHRADRRHVTLRAAAGAVAGQPPTLESALARVLPRVSQQDRRTARRVLEAIVRALQAQVEGLRNTESRHFTH